MEVLVKQLLRVVAAVGILFVPVAAQAQVSAGVRAGVNLADLALDPEEAESRGLTGFVGGVFVTVPVNPIFAFQPEALFSQQGTRFREEGVTVKFKLDYVQVPLLGKFRLGPNVPIAVLVGPSLGFRTSASIDAPGVTDEFNDEFDDTFKRFDFSLVTGVGLDLGPIVIDGRYSWGLTNIVKEDAVAPGESGSAKNRVLSLTAGIRF
jgi:hypothetical protein